MDKSYRSRLLLGAANPVAYWMINPSVPLSFPYGSGSLMLDI